MRPIYHITHLDNLRAIIEDGGLRCDRTVTQEQVEHTGISHAHIKERRTQRSVPKGPKGTLADYVPFYFAPRSPMLYAIHKGQVDNYSGGQEEIVHLVSSVEAVAERKLGYVFTDGHAAMGITRYFTELSDLGEVDWKIMAEVMWNDTNEDGDRKRRRQAEFLVHRFFPWELLTVIGVHDRRLEQQVKTMIENTSHRPHVLVKRDWYY